MNICVGDAGSNLVAFARMDGEWIGSLDISCKKAKTAAWFTMGKAALVRWYIHTSLFTFPGGVMIKMRKKKSLVSLVYLAVCGKRPCNGNRGCNISKVVLLSYAGLVGWLMLLYFILCPHSKSHEDAKYNTSFLSLCYARGVSYLLPAFNRICSPVVIFLLKLTSLKRMFFSIHSLPSSVLDNNCFTLNEML